MSNSEASTPPARAPWLLRWMARRPTLFLALFCVALWLPGVLSLPALDRDESRYAQASRQMLESRNYVDIRFGKEPRYKKPIAVYWLQSATTAIAGRGEHGEIWTYRLASLLGGLMGVWLTYWCARALMEREAAFLAGLMMATSVLLTGESTIATTDAVQIGCVIGAMGMMLRVYRGQRDPEAKKPSFMAVMLGWAAFAAGILVKGFVVPAVAAVTIVALLASDRKAGWLKALRPVSGGLLTLFLVAPWLIAITRASHGAFFAESVGHDFGAKLVSGQETHGAWPGYYLLLSSLCFWPAILFVAPATGAAIARRGEPAVRFLLAWAGASWLMFEVVPTKLPHYVLPAYPALAILTALWLLGPKTVPSVPVSAPAAADGDKKKSRGEGETPAAPPPLRAPLWPRLLGWIAALQFTLGAAALGAAIVMLPRLYATDHAQVLAWMGFSGVGDMQLLLGLAGFGGVLAFITLILALRGARLWALGLGVATVFVFVPTLTVGVGPRLTQLWVSERLKPLVLDQEQPGDPPPVAAGYTEPSLVFALGADLQLPDSGAGAAALGAASGGLSLIEDGERGAFLAGLAEREADATTLATLDGFNYSRGKTVHITLYRVTKVHDAPR